MEKDARNWLYSYQNKVKVVYIKCIKKISEAYGDQRFQTLRDDQHAVIFTAVYERDPLGITRKWLGPCVAVIDLEGIFVGQPQDDAV